MSDGIFWAGAIALTLVWHFAEGVKMHVRFERTFGAKFARLDAETAALVDGVRYVKFLWPFLKTGGRHARAYDFLTRECRGFLHSFWAAGIVLFAFALYALTVWMPARG